MIGLGFCCCGGGCEILGVHNDVTKAAFEKYYTLTEGAAEPVWNGNVPAFSGNTGAKVTAAGARFANDNVGFQVVPTGTFSELRYSFQFGATVYQFVWNYEQEEGATVSVRFRLLKGETALFDSDEFPCYVLTPILDNTLAYIIRREDNAGEPRVCFYVGNNLIDRTEQPETLELDVPVEISCSIEGTGYSLDAANGFTHLFKPDKFWLFPENLPASDLPSGFPSDYEAGDALARPANYDELPTAEKKKWDKVLAGEREREGCAYPESCPAVWENSLPIIPPLKLTFSGWQNKKFDVAGVQGYSHTFQYSALSDKAVAADVATDCNITTGVIPIEARTRHVETARSVQEQRHIDAAAGVVIAESTTYGGEYVYNGDSGLFYAKLGDASDYMSYSIPAPARTLEISNDNDNLVATLTMPTPYHNGATAANCDAVFKIEKSKGAAARLEWRDLIDAKLELEAEPDAAQYIGNSAAVTIVYDNELRTNTDASRTDTVSVRVRMICTLMSWYTIDRDILYEHSYIPNTAQDYDTWTYDKEAGSSPPETGDSAKTYLDATIPLDAVYQTDENGEKDECGEIKQYTNQAPVQVNGFTFETGALAYRQQEGRWYMLVDSSKITGAFASPAVRTGTFGNIAIVDKHIVARNRNHVGNGQTFVFTVKELESNPAQFVGSVLAFNNANNVVVIRPSLTPETVLRHMYCHAHAANEYPENAAGIDCRVYIHVIADIAL